MKLSRRIIGLYVFIASLTAGCGREVSLIDVSPTRLDIKSTEDVPTLTVMILDRDGNEVEDVPLIWESSNPEVVTVDDAGALSVKGSGRATVTVKLNELRQEVPVKVDLCALVKAESPQMELVVGTVATPVVQSLNEKGAPMECPLTWSVTDKAIASVDEKGNVKGISQGETVVTAACGRQTTTVNVNVTLPPPPEPAVDPTSAAAVQAGDKTSEDSPMNASKLVADEDEGDEEKGDEEEGDEEEGDEDVHESI
jgi:hypothetical protein